jgi:hypothetical protein
VVIVQAYGVVIFMLIVDHSFGCERVAYMSTHGFGVFDLRYRYRSISRYFRSDGFVSDLSIFLLSVSFSSVSSLS